MKKTFVLVVLFVFPLVAYLFFASGVNNFGKLPVLTQNIPDVPTMEQEVTLNGKITILGFLGTKVESMKGNAFNLNQKIYKRFGEFTDFQVVMVVPNGNEEQANALKEELGQLSNVDKWHFAFGEEAQIISFFKDLKTNTDLDDDLSTPYVFIIDKDRNLRGREDDEDEGLKYGFDTSSVAELNNKMEDDVKIILAEYRLALKKNNADRSK
ncbi:hypothetical protein SAMN04487891_103228 [Flagellimonas taeanensis]|uniref:Uncharacterized protein n=1 Tax=Flagellimonas taeanensis TaxID=1005926 RepID=A0A1M6TIR1_9FLAO|nr:hypothetical protein [Allomuricauda taeanensis]SFB88471.1 hypothetical protein SAMN04487891_103228 [Allomuricauda taeanensis]SHK56628.1 hypothetical protein SAMN05216293_1389 [Allomuricauda taeanensis]